MAQLTTTTGIPPLKSLTLAQVASGLDSGTFTVVQLVQAHLDQIRRFDAGLHAVLQLNPNALSIAEKLDSERQKSGRRSLLHGVPILIKDNVVTHEPLEATAGSLALLGAKPARESPVVAKLRNAGCVILGTANCSEWANFRSRPSDSGWSPRGGQTYGAYHDKQDPGGSSSGSGVAVDMGFCVLAIGTETSGSIISPSMQNNIVGLKPTTGLVSRDSVIPISPEQDTLGPMARTVADAAAMLSVIAGSDEHDPKTAGIPFSTIPDYRVASMIPLPASGKPRLGIPQNALEGVDKFTVQAFNDLIVEPLRSRHGVTIVDCIFAGMERFKDQTANEKTTYMAGELHDALPAYFASLVTNPHGIDSLEALCAFTKATEGEQYGEDEQPVSSPTDEKDERPRRNILRLELAANMARNAPEYLAARESAAYFAGPGGIQGALEGQETSGGQGPVDALLLPTAAAAANYFAACEGHPQITIPLGYRAENARVKRNDTGRLVLSGPNTPFGVSIIGRKYDEYSLLTICAAIEKLTQVREKAESKRPAHLRT